MSYSAEKIEAAILDHVPTDGSAIGNQALFAALQELFPRLSEQVYHSRRDALIASGELTKGRGRGGSVFRTEPALEDSADEDAEVNEADEDADEFELEIQDAPATRAGRVGAKKKKQAKSSDPAQILSYRFTDTRVNNPEVGMVHPENDPDQPRTTYAYDPHIDPALMFDSARARVEKVIDDALASNDVAVMRDALAELKAMQAPYLNWSGKAERTSFEVDTVSLHVHERVDPATILANARKRLKGEKPLEIFRQADLFAAPFENLPLRQALDFYHHEKGWSNRLIAGDSLLVMNSLLQKEAMAGKVQMIYIDPPYGIKYGSNFQPFTNKRDVKDGADADLTQEPEMIKAFRDTWELGIHSYLTYLRDRLLLAKDLLHESGSVFVQIDIANIHLVSAILDEIFGSLNRIVQISFVTSNPQTGNFVSDNCDYILWYGKNKSSTKFHTPYLPKAELKGGAAAYRFARTSDGRQWAVSREEKQNLIDDGAARIFRGDKLTSAHPPGSYNVEFEGRPWKNDKGYWSTSESGMARLKKANRLIGIGNTLTLLWQIQLR